MDRPCRAEIGFAEDDYITASYARLWLDWCEWHGVRPSIWCFSDPLHNLNSTACDDSVGRLAACGRLSIGLRNGSFRTRIVASSTDTARPWRLRPPLGHTLRIRSACCLEFSPRA